MPKTQISNLRLPDFPHLPLLHRTSQFVTFSFLQKICFTSTPNYSFVLPSFSTPKNSTESSFNPILKSKSEIKSVCLSIKWLLRVIWFSRILFLQICVGEGRILRKGCMKYKRILKWVDFGSFYWILRDFEG